LTKDLRGSRLVALLKFGAFALREEIRSRFGST
jgi:hypothetical protein